MNFGWRRPVAEFKIVGLEKVLSNMRSVSVQVRGKIGRAAVMFGFGPHVCPG